MKKLVWILLMLKAKKKETSTKCIILMLSEKFPLLMPIKA